MQVRCGATHSGSQPHTAAVSHMRCHTQRPSATGHCLHTLSFYTLSFGRSQCKGTTVHVTVQRHNCDATVQPSACACVEFYFIFKYLFIERSP